MSKISTVENALLLKEAICNNPGNLSKAFREVAAKIGSTARSLAHLYYAVPNSCLHKNNLGTCFIIISDNVILENTKIKKE